LVRLLTAPSVLLEGRLVTDGWILYADGRILEVGTGRPPHAPGYALATGVLAPGLVDLQCNGAFGHDLAEVDVAGWREVLSRLPATGVTAVVPTVITAPFDMLLATLRDAPVSTDHGPRAARPLGLHLEGPFLSAQRRGAHREDLLRSPAAADVDAVLEAGRDRLTYVTVAPELPGALPVIERFVRAGVRVAIGHSDATDAEVLAAVDAGATLVTHLYNAQRPLAHRDPGVVGAALSDPRLTLGLIADLHHVAPTALRVAFAAAGERIALVTDAIPTLGLPAGSYRFGGDTVTVTGPDAPPRRDDGTLAGSSLRLDLAVRNTISCGVDPAVALTAATTIPADAVGAPRAGRLRPGAYADLTWFDERWQLRASWLAGEQVAGEPLEEVPA
jgi:N-acetylglucosamine-6-phosphate deacetylase